MYQQKTPLRPNGLFEWAFLILGVWAGIGFLTRLLAGRQAGIGWLDLFIFLAAVYWFGVRKGWFEHIKASLNTPSESEDLATVSKSTEEAQEPSEATEAFEIIVPRSSEWKPAVAAAFMKAFYERIGKKGCYLAIIATNENIFWQITSNFTRDALESFVKQFYPGAQVRPLEYYEREYPHYRRYTVLSMDAYELFDLYTPVTDNPRFDALELVVQTMNQLQTDETVGFGLSLGRPILTDDQSVFEFLTMSAHDAGYRVHRNFPTTRGFEETMGGLAVSIPFAIYDRMKLKKQRVDRFDERKTQEYLSKLKQKISWVSIFSFMDTPDKDRLDILTSVTGAVKGLTSHSQARLGDGVTKEARIINRDEALKFDPFMFLSTWNESFDALPVKEKEKLQIKDLYVHPMTADETATFWHLPHEGFSGLRVNWIPEEKAPLPAVMHNAPEDALLLGYAYANGQKLPARMLEKDRPMHMIITGQIGMGKSTLMHNLIHQDIEHGRGVAVIDPKGHLVSDVLERSIRAGRESDVEVWDLANTEKPPPLNFLLNPTGAPRGEATAVLMAVFEKIYGKDFSSTQMAETLQRSFETVMAGETPTLRDVNKLLTDDDYRDALTSQTSNIAAEEFWAAFDAMRESERTKLFAPVLRRLRDLYGHELLYPILCNPQMLNVRQLMEQKKIILISLKPPQNQSPPLDDLSLLGSLLVSEFQLAVSTAKLPEPFYLYVDEAHRFVTSSLDQIFVMARSQNLHMILATQYPKQLPTDTLQAILENVGATVAFKCAEDTARVIKGRMQPQFDDHDLINFDRFQAAARIFYDEKQMPPFLLETVEAPPKPDGAEERAAEIRKASDERNRRKTREEILKWLTERYPRPRSQKREEEKSVDEAYQGWSGSDQAPDG